MPAKIVVLGATGMLGHKMLQKLRPHFPLVIGTMYGRRTEEPYSRIPLFDGPDIIEELDVLDWEGLSTALRNIAPDVVVNCVGIIKQREAAHEYIPSIAINSLLPHRLAELLAEWNGRLIHFSTDCVFSGRRGMYTETDFSDAEDLYGKSKFLGETPEKNALTIRTSIIGRELTNHRSLLDWFLSNKGRKVWGYRRSIWSGLTTNQLAGVVHLVIEQHPELYGVYHVANNPITKYDLLCLIRDAYGLEIEIELVDGENVDRSMDGIRFQSATGYQGPDWPKLLRDLAEDPTPYGEWLGSEQWRLGAELLAPETNK